MFGFRSLSPDHPNPFVGKHVPLTECYVINLPRGPSMLDEKMACPMQDAAHERRFWIAQHGRSSSNFEAEHVGIISRYIQSLESVSMTAYTDMRLAIAYLVQAPAKDESNHAHALTGLTWKPEDWISSTSQARDYASEVEEDVEGASPDGEDACRFAGQVWKDVKAAGSVRSGRTRVLKDKRTMRKSAAMLKNRIGERKVGTLLAIS